MGKWWSTGRFFVTRHDNEFDFDEVVEIVGSQHAAFELAKVYANGDMTSDYAARPEFADEVGEPIDNMNRWGK